jgi:hypothetical protein
VLLQQVHDDEDEDRDPRGRLDGALVEEGVEDLEDRTGGLPVIGAEGVLDSASSSFQPLPRRKPKRWRL